MGPVAAQVHFTAQVSTKEMGKSDYVEVQFVIENASQIENLQPPDFPDFTIVQGPSQSTGMSIVNGAMSQYKGISYVLQPKKTGVLIIKPATATVDGQMMHTSPVRITVNNTPGKGNTAGPGFSPLPDPSWPTARPPVDMDEVVKPGENVAEKIRRNFFIKVEVSKSDCYLGEPIVATYKLYARLRSDSRVTHHPSLNGFSVYDMIDPSDDRVTVEKVNGKNFSVHTIRKTQLIPLQSGDITLDPVELDNNIYFIKADGEANKNPGQGLGGLLDRLFEPEVSGTPFTQHIVLESKPVVIHVRPLPETGKPADYSGAVGNYSLHASIDSREVDTGDAAILSVTIKGSGNLPLINAPAVNWPAEMESYDVSSKENINKAYAPLGGSKTFSYSFVSSRPGKYDLPPVRLSYFDPVSRTYKTTESEPLHIQVNKAQKKKQVVPLAAPVVVQTNWTRYAVWSALFLFLVLLVIWVFRKTSRDAAVKAEKIKQEAALDEMTLTPVMIDPLKESREFMFAGEYGKFYASVNRSVWKAVSERLQLPASELSKLHIAEGLRSGGWTDDEIIQLKNVLNECEMKLYTPEYSSTDVERLLRAADEICLKLKA